MAALVKPAFVICMKNPAAGPGHLFTFIFCVLPVRKSSDTS